MVDSKKHDTEQDEDLDEAKEAEDSDDEQDEEWEDDDDNEWEDDDDEGETSEEVDLPDDTDDDDNEWEDDDDAGETSEEVDLSDNTDDDDNDPHHENEKPPLAQISQKNQENLLNPEHKQSEEQGGGQASFVATGAAAALGGIALGHGLLQEKAIKTPSAEKKPEFSRVEASHVETEMLSAPQGVLALKTSVDFDVGQARASLAQIQSWGQGTVVELDPPQLAAGVEVTLRVNGDKIGTGELVVIDDRIAVRIIQLFFKK